MSGGRYRIDKATGQRVLVEPPSRPMSRTERREAEHAAAQEAVELPTAEAKAPGKVKPKGGRRGGKTTDAPATDAPIAGDQVAEDQGADTLPADSQE